VEQVRVFVQVLVVGQRLAAAQAGERVHELERRVAAVEAHRRDVVEGRRFHQSEV
jgi:hypothetical protein